MNPDQLIQQLVKHGGAIVSSNDCSPIEIANAQACGRFAVEPETGLGFTRRPKEWDGDEGDREDAHWKTVRCLTTTVCCVAGFSSAWLTSKIGVMCYPVANSLAFMGGGVFLLGFLATVTVAMNRPK